MSGGLAWLLVAGVVNGASCAGMAEETELLPGSEAWVLALFASLPWETEVTDLSEITRALGPDACVAGVERRFSHRLHTRTLHLELSVSEYPAPCGAEEAFEATLAAADPDTGLTYAWDLLLLAEQRLARLHAECRWSEANFERIAGVVEERLAEQRWRVARKVLCRCGGGCREIGGEDGRNRND